MVAAFPEQGLWSGEACQGFPSLRLILDRLQKGTEEESTTGTKGSCGQATRRPLPLEVFA